ncbi:hypothetical protein LTS18_000462, partial [Coniosporium uncinatum]
SYGDVVAAQQQGPQMAAFALQGVQRQGRVPGQEQGPPRSGERGDGTRGNDMRGLEALVAAAARENGGVGSRG